MSWRNRTLIAIAALVVGLSSGGCDRSTVTASDPDQAYKVLSEALDAWRAGKSVANLRESSPPVYVADELWQPSFQLVNFTIDQPGQRYGTNVLFRATLQGSGSNRSDATHEVRYLVTTTPAMTIARYDR